MFGVSHIDGEGILRLPDGTHTVVNYEVDMPEGNISIHFNSRLLSVMMSNMLMQKKPVELTIDKEDKSVRE